MPSIRRVIGIGSSTLLLRQQGLYQVDIVQRAGLGSTTLYAAAESVMELFRPQHQVSSGGVVVTPRFVTASGVRTENDWDVLTIRVEWFTNAASAV